MDANSKSKVRSGMAQDNNNVARLTGNNNSLARFDVVHRLLSYQEELTSSCCY